MQQFESFAQMQRDAAMRVMEMQRRAQAAMRVQTPPSVPSAITDSTENSPLCEPDTEFSAVTEEHIKPGNTEISEEETERALITAILLLLIKENADERLLFALLYILM